MKTAREYWKERFGEYPKTDADKLSVAFAQEYAKEVLDKYKKENPCGLPDSIQEALNSGDGTYRP